MRSKWLLIAACFVGCTDPHESKLMPDGKRWTVANLAVEVPGSTCYDTLIAHCERYGRLYTWQAATTACARLGTEWRLPTNDEWATLAKHYGGVRDDSQDGGKSAFQSMTDGGSSEFNALLSGGLDADGVYRRLEAHGFYWTVTETSDTTAWVYNFGKGGKILNRHEDGNKEEA